MTRPGWGEGGVGGRLPFPHSYTLFVCFPILIFSSCSASDGQAFCRKGLIYKGLHCPSPILSTSTATWSVIHSRHVYILYMIVFCEVSTRIRVVGEVKVPDD